LYRFYTNENFPVPSVIFLREIGYDVQTSQDAGNAGISMVDKDVLNYAINNNRAVLTLNRRHFIQLHKINPHHFGIIVCKVDSDFQRLAKKIHETVVSYKKLNGELIRINRE
jgi:hypothetical protein